MLDYTYNSIMSIYSQRQSLVVKPCDVLNIYVYIHTICICIYYILYIYYMYIYVGLTLGLGVEVFDESSLELVIDAV